MELPVQLAGLWTYGKRFKLTLLCCLLLLCIGLPQVKDYGITWDEPTEVAMIDWNYHYITKGDEIPSDLKYYGTFFNGLSEGLFQINRGIKTWANQTFLSSDKSPETAQEQTYLGLNDYLSQRIRSYRDRIYFKHYITFIFSLGAYLGVAHLLGILLGPNYGWCGVIALALFPQFWGHSFFNPKDIPFAVVMTIVTLMNAKAIGFLAEIGEQDAGNTSPKAQQSQLFKPLLLWGLGLGSVWGMMGAIRIPGIFAIVFFGLTYGLVSLSHKSLRSQSVAFIMLGTIASITAYGWMIIFYPASWSSPLGFFLEALGYFSKHSWSNTVHFNGQFIPGDQLPWSYLPTWFAMATPALGLIAAIAGLLLVLNQYRQASALQKATISLVVLQLLALPLLAILRGSVIYNGLRHFLFVIPMLAVLATVAAVRLYQTLQPWPSLRLGYGIFGVIVCGQIIGSMVTLHPYQYLYINQVSGGLQMASERYETDYWGLSLKEVITWFNTNTEPGNILFFDGPFSIQMLQIAPNQITLPVTVLMAPNQVTTANFVLWYDRDPAVRSHHDQLFREQLYLASRTIEENQAFYYLDILSDNNQEQFPQCPVIYSAERQGVALTILRRCTLE